MTTDERIEAIETVNGDCAQIEVDWLIAELRRAREALREISSGPLDAKNDDTCWQCSDPIHVEECVDYHCAGQVARRGLGP